MGDADAPAAEAPGTEDSQGDTDVQSTGIGAGTVLKDRFLLLKEIGQGGLSTVYKARDLVAAKAGLSDPNVAVKIIQAAPGVDPDIISLMHREARRLRELVHPNIVRVYDMDREGDVHFMIMELLEGRPLSRVLREATDNRLPPARLFRLVRDLSSALAYAHKTGIIHADLKPGNVFVLNSGGAKLIDFNIAYPIARPVKTREEDTIVILARFGAVTPAYASPQRLKGAEPCEADDVFSLAMIAYLALSGTRPFGQKNALEAREEDVKVSRLPDLSWLRWRALRAGLSLSDSGRTPSVRQFCEGFCQPNPMALVRSLVAAQLSAAGR
ncbi:serine/threonine-protein kinase [Roseibium marinum]|uniref:Protein kinase-like protein n=1 Tax=Roseibium marinum TaxID=281252 RepID=A0A2S3V1F3_9HYPH|nr:serine/threonine-protein kinase [Roseibium marinum]POF33786.1 protein kinase-like protein [Roseibium marinum]